MSLTITETRIVSDRCSNVAELHAGGWTVTGYLGRLFDRDQATTAMLLAELLAIALPADRRTGLLARTWRAELGVTDADGPHSAALADRPDGTRSDRASSLTTTWGAASSAKTTTAPHDPATSKSNEVHTS
ncbi:hypothetical protein [Nonomuraea angiospora]